MDESSDVVKHKWFRSIILTLLGSWAIELASFIYRAWSGQPQFRELSVTTLHSLWDIPALIGLLVLARKLKARLGVYIPALLVGATLITILSGFLPMSLPLNARYFGVESRRSRDAHFEGNYDYPLERRGLRRAEAPELAEDLDAAAEYNESVRARGFLFWQTGAAAGYNPWNVTHERPESFIDNVEIFVTAGPLVLTECLILGLCGEFLPLMALQAIWFAIRRRLIWWDF
jgi:hypothetical protein